MSERWRERAVAIREQIDAAHEAVAAGDAAGAGWRARTATEAMLQLLAERHEVDVPGGPGRPTTLETLRKALRHAKLLDRKLEDHVSHVQNIGNRAAHAQPDDTLAVDLDEARTLLPALERAWAHVCDSLPDDVAPPPAPPPRVGVGRLALRAAAFLGVLGLTATLTAVGIGAVGRAVTTPAPAPLTTPGPRIDADALEAMLATPPPALEPVVWAHDRLASDDLTGRTCDELQWARNAVWASHGLVFRSQAARDHLATVEAYVPWRNGARADVERTFDDADHHNLALLSDTVAARGCPCADAARRGRPCPD